jgi:hypothetical protein
MIADDLRLLRLVRTLTSEVYLLWDEDQRAGQVDIHFADDIIHATIVLEADLDEQEIRSLIKRFDREVVSSHRQDYERENFLVTVFRGSEVYLYADEGTEGPNMEW